MSEDLQIILIAFSIFGLGMLSGYVYGNRTLRQEAVEAGAAAWCVVDTAGRVEFRWKSEIHSSEKEKGNQCTTR